MCKANLLAVCFHPLSLSSVDARGAVGTINVIVGTTGDVELRLMLGTKAVIPMYHDCCVRYPFSNLLVRFARASSLMIYLPVFFSLLLE